MTDNEHQYVIECDRAKGAIQQAVTGMEDFGGNVDIFAFTMLLTSFKLFSAVHDFEALQKAITQMLIEEQKRHQPCGRA